MNLRELTIELYKDNLIGLIGDPEIVNDDLWLVLAQIEVLDKQRAHKEVFQWLVNSRKLPEKMIKVFISDNKEFCFNLMGFALGATDGQGCVDNILTSCWNHFEDEIKDCLVDIVKSEAKAA